MAVPEVLKSFYNDRYPKWRPDFLPGIAATSFVSNLPKSAGLCDPTCLSVVTGELKRSSGADLHKLLVILRVLADWISTVYEVSDWFPVCVCGGEKEQCRRGGVCKSLWYCFLM